MGSELFDVIRRVGIFIICAQAIVHFRPHDSYEKYFRLLISIIVLVLILSPIFQFLGKGEFVLSLDKYEVGMENELEKINSKLNNLDKAQMEDTMPGGESSDTALREETESARIETIEAIETVEVGE